MWTCSQDNLEYKTLELPVKKSRSERAELIQFFVDRLRNKDGKPFSARLIAVKLSHLKDLQDLYYFKSVCEDTLNRKGLADMQKFFWWSIKAK